MKQSLILLLSLTIAPFALALDYSEGAIVELFKTNVACDTGSDPFRYVCPITQIAQGKAPAVNNKSGFLGFSFTVKDGESKFGSAFSSEELSYLVLSPNGAILKSIKPSNEQEKREIAEPIAYVSAVLKGLTNEITVSKSLGSYLTSLQSGPLHPITRSENYWEFQGNMPSKIFAVSGQSFGVAYVVIERDKNGSLVSLFPGVKVSFPTTETDR